MPRLYRLIHATAFRLLLLRPARRVACRMVTVSDIMEQHDLREVGLLKVNAERAEEEVLEGVRPEHWPRIQQVCSFAAKI